MDKIQKIALSKLADIMTKGVMKRIKAKGIDVEEKVYSRDLFSRD